VSKPVAKKLVKKSTSKKRWYISIHVVHTANPMKHFYSGYGVHPEGFESREGARAVADGMRHEFKRTTTASRKRKD